MTGGTPEAMLLADVLESVFDMRMTVLPHPACRARSSCPTQQCRGAPRGRTAAGAPGTLPSSAPAHRRRAPPAHRLEPGRPAS